MNHFEYLCCPKCKSDLNYYNNFIVCNKCSEKYEINDGIIKIIPKATADIELSIDKWDENYKKQLDSESFYNDYEKYRSVFLYDVYKNIASEKDISSELVYLEIGCGPFFLGNYLANKTKLVIGIDFCPSALRIAKKLLDENGIKNYILIQGNILNLPLKSNKIDLIYGGGVIEHFENTQTCLDELCRVLRHDGVSINSVPYLNISSLTYRQIWGNIPNAPVLKQLAEFIHIKLLKKRHMRFGYEMSFLVDTLKKIHKKAGFGSVKVGNFKIKYSFDYAPAFLRSFLSWLAGNFRFFWPMIKVVGRK